MPVERTGRNVQFSAGEIVIVRGTVPREYRSVYFPLTVARAEQRGECADDKFGVCFQDWQGAL